MTKLFNKLKKNIYILAIFWAKFFYPENSAVKNNLRKRPGRRNGRRADPVLQDLSSYRRGYSIPRFKAKKTPLKTDFFSPLKKHRQKVDIHETFPALMLKVNSIHQNSTVLSFNFGLLPVVTIFFGMTLQFLQISDLNHPQYIFLFSPA